MGQSIVDGNLPYVELWDLKPPLIFFYFAAAIFLFGKSMIAIRFMGVVAVWITAIYLYKIGERISLKTVGAWSGLLYVFLSSLFGDLQGVMSEHFCMLFFMIGLWHFIKAKHYVHYLITGIFFGFAVMTKLNIAYAILFLSLFLVYKNIFSDNLYKALVRGTVLAMGLILIVFVTIIPYYLTDKFEIWYNSVILAALNYANYDSAKFYKTLGVIVPIVVVNGFFFWFLYQKKTLRNNDLLVIFIALIGVLFSFLKIGKVNGHYLIQAYPFMILLLVLTLSFLNVKQLNYKPLILLLLLGILYEPIGEYIFLIKRGLNHKSLYKGEGFDVPHYLKENYGNIDNIFFVNYHIGYWIMDKKPPTKSCTHPSNLKRSYNYSLYGNPRKSTLEEIKFIMEVKRPEIVVSKENKINFLNKAGPENTYFQKSLDRNYTLLKDIGKAKVFKRKEG